ncbi:MAG: M24 family metallopeptidase, partial [Clostridia bacterium]
RAFGLLHPSTREVLILFASNYEAAWAETSPTLGTISTIDTDEDPLDRLVDLILEAVPPGGRVGCVDAQNRLSAAEWFRLRKDLGDRDWVDITDISDEMRSIKSSFEVAAMQNLGQILSEAMDIFAETLHPGIRAWEAGAAAEAHVKASGAFRGWHKFSLDGRPFSMPAPLERKLTRDDVITFELDYCGPYGYWCELSTVFSFAELSTDDARRLALTERAVWESAAAAVPGMPKGVVGEISERLFREAGYRVRGAHTRHCHSIGTDDLDRREPLGDRDLLRENMVLSYHPAVMPEDGRAFLISDNFVITSRGAKPLSPRGQAHRIVG